MVKLKIKRESGRLFLYVDAAELHELLDSIGVTHTEGNYDDRPYCQYNVLNSACTSVSTNLLLVREYPHRVDLTRCFTDPPSVATLRRLCESAQDQTRKILEHYQPIDISIEIHKKVVV